MLIDISHTEEKSTGRNSEARNTKNSLESFFLIIIKKKPQHFNSKAINTKNGLETFILKFQNKIIVFLYQF